MTVTTPRHPTRYIVAEQTGDGQPFVVLRPAELGGHDIYTQHARLHWAERQAAYINTFTRRK